MPGPIRPAKVDGVHYEQSSGTGPLIASRQLWLFLFVKLFARNRRHPLTVLCWRARFDLRRLRHAAKWWIDIDSPQNF